MKYFHPPKRESSFPTLTKKKLGLKQFPWIKTIFMFLDPNQRKYSKGPGAKKATRKSPGYFNQILNFES